MATIVNPRDVLLQAAVPRITTTTVSIAATSLAFNDSSGTVTPSSITLTATTTNFTSATFVWEYALNTAPNTWITVSGSTNTITITNSAFIGYIGASGATGVIVRTTASQTGYSSSNYVINIDYKVQGSTGTDGLSTYTATVYTQAATQPDPASGGSYTFTGDILVPPDGTTASIPTTSATPTWATSYTFQTNTPATPVPGPLGAGDVDIATVKLIAKPSGSTVIDVSPSARTITGLGDCTVSTEQTLFGAPIIKSPAGEPLVWPVSSDWDLNRTEWQWDIWFYKTSASNSLVARRQPSTTNGWVICDDSIRAKINGTWSDTAMLWTRPSENAWHLLTLNKNGTTLRAFIDGTLVATLTGVTTIYDLTANPLAFFQADNGSENRANGYFSQARFGHKCRYTASFTLPTAPWPSSSDSGTGWPPFVRILQDGAGGESGIVVFAYQRSSSGAPALPSVDATYTFATKTLSGLNNGWSAVIPTGTTPLYITAATARSAGATDTITSSEWSPAQLFAASGLNSAPILLYKRTTTSTAPSTISADVTYTFATGVVSGLTNGWTQELPPTGGGWRWVINATALSPNTTDTVTIAEFSAVALLAEDGTDAVAATLSSYQVVFTADATGTVDSGQSYPVTVRVMQGSTDATGSWTVNTTPSDSSITAAVSGSTITITANDSSVENDYVDVSITRSGFVTQTARIGISKLRRATTGPTSGYLSDLGTSVIYAYATSGLAISTLFIETDGRFRQQVNSGTIENVPYAAYYTPTTAGVGTGTWCRVTKLNGGTLAAGSVGSWQELTAQLEYRAQLGGTGDRLVKLKVETASGSGGTPLLGTGYVDLQVEYG